MQKIKHIQAISLAVLLSLSGCANHTPENAVAAQTFAQEKCSLLYAKNPAAVGSFEDCYMWVASSLYNGKTLSTIAKEEHSYRESVCTNGFNRRNTDKWKTCVAESKLSLAGIDTILQNKQIPTLVESINPVQSPKQNYVRWNDDPTESQESGHASVQQQASSVCSAATNKKQCEQYEAKHAAQPQLNANTHNAYQNQPTPNFLDRLNKVATDLNNWSNSPQGMSTIMSMQGVGSDVQAQVLQQQQEIRELQSPELYGGIDRVQERQLNRALIKKLNEPQMPQDNSMNCTTRYNNLLNQMETNCY